MAKFFGKIGFSQEDVETSPGIFESVIIEKEFNGDVVRESRSLDSSNEVNNSFRVTNRISIIANQYVYANVGNIKYVVYMGAKWKVTSMEIKAPRIILSLGGVYNA